MISPANKIKMYENTLRCYHRAIWGLVPVIGCGFVASAFWFHARGWEFGAHKHPLTRPYLKAGFILAWLGIPLQIASVIFALLAVIALIDSAY